MASTFVTGLLWVAWDHAQALFWVGGPSLNPSVFWFTPIAVAMMLQVPAIIGVGLYHLIFARLHRTGTRFILYPYISFTSMLTTEFVAGVHLSMSIPLFLLVAVPKTAIYGLVFAALDYVGARRAGMRA
jgi:hypothetical protein